MKVAEFARVVRIGLGRAIIVLQTGDPRPYRDVILSALITLYENGPCSHCRERCVDLLHRLGILPDWIAQECLHDANPDLREKASSWRRP